MGTTNYGNANFNNRVMKMPETTLAPLSFIVPDGYTFQRRRKSYIHQRRQFTRKTDITRNCPVSPNFMYTCDGATLKKWNKTTGALITSVVVAGTPRTCGGLDVDDCDNVYLGIQSAVNKYDVKLNSFRNHSNYEHCL